MQVAVRRLGRVRGPEGLEGALRSMMLEGSLRTYIMDMAGGGFPGAGTPAQSAASGVPGQGAPTY